MRSPNYNLVESYGGLLGLCWVSVGSLISPWNTASFQSSSQNGLSKKALQMSSPNWDLFRVRFAGDLLEVQWVSIGSPTRVCWESTGSLLGVRWESAASSLGVGWESTWSLLGFHLESAGSSLNGLFKRALQIRSPNYKPFESVGSLVGVCWVSFGILISP